MPIYVLVDVDILNLYLLCDFKLQPYIKLQPECPPVSIHNLCPHSQILYPEDDISSLTDKQ